MHDPSSHFSSPCRNSFVCPYSQFTELYVISWFLGSSVPQSGSHATSCFVAQELNETCNFLQRLLPGWSSTETSSPGKWSQPWACQCSRSIWTTLSAAWFNFRVALSRVRSWTLMILMGPFQFRIFCDSLHFHWNLKWKINIAELIRVVSVQVIWIMWEFKMNNY